VFSEDDEIGGLRRNLLIDDAEVASDIDTSIAFVFSVKRVIVEKRVKGVAEKKISPFLELTSFRRG